ncbi:MAG: helix-turn-helix domain-containing protein [bacterium]|nr:helix-turn-helix domain-containing protein [bacterium]
MPKLEIKLTARAKKFLVAKRREEKLSKRFRDRIEILLLSDKGRSNEDITDILQTTNDTIWRVRKRYLEEGMESAISEKPRSGQPEKYNMAVETELTAIACSDAPEGRKRWTLELLAKHLRDSVNGCETINRETVRLILKKTNVSLG